ncbi:NAD(P)/FAD-dependent oxidoreductase [Brachybacterium phenoliresistens]|uniref:Oxidoreductase n=1 Tax=Brachybacterium phenoliresistens TaxID=396014 RepID=Z9JRH7_9MICO|nr:NAD(P)/FAD-dependent oxidoreductase [Brachybacterium phenoliresistens]EWS80357.1 oxidoreductase [Brachybacterium phenoliresistens]
MSSDLIVIGAGPAGLACAVTAADAGIAVALVDANLRPGGQFWRHGAAHVPSAHGHGHHGWRTFTRLRARLAHHVGTGRIAVLPATHAWMIEPIAGAGGPAGFRVHVTPSADASAARTPGGPGPGSTRALEARQLAVCTGAYDRQLPIPGWDLPGVLAAGGAQAFVKTTGTAPGRRAVVAGTGPFLLPVAAGLADAGARVLAVCEAHDPRRWLPHAHRLAAAPEKLLEGAQYAAAFARRRVPYRPRTAVTRALGRDRLEAVEIARVDARGAVLPGTARRIDCDLLALGWGFTPLLELPLSLGAATRLDADSSLVLEVDDAGRTSVPGLLAAGETTGVGGAALALAEGLRIGRTAAGRPVPAGSARRIGRLRAVAGAMHRAHPLPEAWPDLLEEDTVVCRCEEVGAGEILAARRDLEGRDIRSAKSFTRAGMGWCQGRECALAVGCLTAEGGRPGADALAAASRRPLSVPVTLGALATLGQPEGPADASAGAPAPDRTPPVRPAPTTGPAAAGLPDREDTA